MGSDRRGVRCIYCGGVRGMGPGRRVDRADVHLQQVSVWLVVLYDRLCSPGHVCIDKYRQQLHRTSKLLQRMATVVEPPCCREPQNHQCSPPRCLTLPVHIFSPPSVSDAYRTSSADFLEWPSHLTCQVTAKAGRATGRLCTRGLTVATFGACLSAMCDNATDSLHSHTQC